MKVPVKTSFKPFKPFLGQKYIACGDKMVFLRFLANFFQSVDVVWSSFDI